VKIYVSQYSIIFYLTWIFLYIAYPAWALPIPITARFAVFLALLMYFTGSAYLMNLSLNPLLVARPFLIGPKELMKHIKENIWLFILCFIAIALHLYPITLPVMIGGDEASHLHAAAAIYVYIDGLWREFLSIPIQIAFWIGTGLVLIVIIQKRLANSALNWIQKRFSSHTPNSFTKAVFFTCIFLAFLAYFILLRTLPYHEALTRFPPIAKLLYLASYFYLGITEIGPRLLQIGFYVLGAIYLYRTIELFRDKDIALLGASIYLFSPLVFYYAKLAELGCGTIFFIIIISYYFLRFIRNESSRDLLLTSYFLGIGFLYKRNLLLMLIICLCYLVFNKLKDNDTNLWTFIKVLLLSLIPIIPWFIIGQFYAWRKYEIIWSQLFSFDKLNSYLMMIPSQISWIIFSIFLLSIVFAFFKKADLLSTYFGFLFIAYYLFYTVDRWELIDRFSLAFYPTIAIFLAQFVVGIARKIRRKHSFKLVFCSFTIYLILISTIWQAPPLKAGLVTYKNIETSYFPCDRAMMWVKKNVGEDEKVLVVRIPPAAFYRDRYEINRIKIIGVTKELKRHFSCRRLHSFFKINKVSYIMFSYGPADAENQKKELVRYLKDNSDNKFTKVREFNLGENFIYIYKI